MSTNPVQFAANFLAQPWPTMGMAPSSVPIKSGGTVIQAGSGADGIGKTSETMWARIAAGIPFGWTLGGLAGAVKGTGKVATAVKEKIEQGSQAVEDKVKSTVSGAFTTVKWTFVIVVIVAVVFFLAQVKSLFRN